MDFDNSNSGEGPSVRWETALENWTSFIELSRSRLGSSSTALRIDWMREQLIPLLRNQAFEMRHAQDLLRLIVLTYTLYVDRDSRDSAEAVLEVLSRSTWESTQLQEQLVQWMHGEAFRICKYDSSQSTSAASQFALLNWTCRLYTSFLSQDAAFSASSRWSSLVSSMAILYYAVQDSSRPVKPALRRSATMRVRRAVRSSPPTIPRLVGTLLSLTNTVTPNHLLAPFLGLCLDVAAHLRPPRKVDLDNFKSEIITFICNSIIMSKVVVHSHSVNAFEGFFSRKLQEDDLANSLVPTIEKALLRSPEVSLPVIHDILEVYSSPISAALFKRILTSVANSAKSGNVQTRVNAVKAFRALVNRSNVQEQMDACIMEILGPIKTGKTMSPEHRIALLEMLAYLPTGPASSLPLADALPSVLLKESNDTACQWIGKALTAHFRHCLQIDILPASAPTVVKEMSNTKPLVRRTLCLLVGNVLWGLQEEDLTKESVSRFGEQVFPSLDATLKSIIAGSVPSTAVAVEGYIAIATLLGPLSRAGNAKIRDLISRSPSLKTFSVPQTKTPFLLAERVYSKLVDPADEAWLLRALEAALTHSTEGILKEEQLCILYGSVYILHLCLAASSGSRKAAVESIAKLNKQQPELANSLLRTALFARLQSGTSLAPTAVINELPAASRIIQQRLLQALFASFTFAEGYAEAKRCDLLVNLLLPCHHQNVCGDSWQLWIDCCQRAHVNPGQLVESRNEELLNIIAEFSIPRDKGITFIRAAIRAATALSFVAPSVILPRIMQQVRLDLDSDGISTINSTYLAIWRTPDGVLFHDVLSAAKKKTGPEGSGKDRDIEKWEAEIRSNLAKKKGAQPTLSTEDRRLVDEQLIKEKKIRRLVDKIRFDIERGLGLVISMVDSQTSELSLHIAEIITLIEGVIRYGADLVRQPVVETYLALSKRCSERLGSLHHWIGVAALRVQKSELLPITMQAEPLDDLVLRLLLRLRFLSEQTAFDVTTFCYCFPLIRCALQGGEVGTASQDEELERATLALDAISFHRSEFANNTLPRLGVLKTLMQALRRHSQLSKDTTSTLVEISQTLHQNASAEETQALIYECLANEVHVRSAVLQALQPFDLTDIDWSPQIWLACHDDDEQNTRLALHLWEDNGMDVPTNFALTLLPYIEHSHHYVRSRAPFAIADSVEHWPNQGSATVMALMKIYEEKARDLAPEFDQYGMILAHTVDRPDPWPTRLAVAQSLEALVPHLTPNEIAPLFSFLIDRQALGDKNGDVRRGMLAAGIAAIDRHGKDNLAALITLFEDRLGQPTPGNEIGDHVHESTIIFFGRVARHLSKTDSRLPSILDRLLVALRTPSEQVQIAVSECIAPLAPHLRPVMQKTVEDLFKQLFDAPKYAERRGAAYGLAGIVHGLGVGVIQEFDVLDRLQTAVEEKKRYEPKQGAMFALETFSNTLGRLFEPYVTYTLPLLLTAFGDTNAEVREATQDAAKAIMANLSGYGLKLVLPDLLAGLAEKQWRTKKGAIDFLGNMAYCAPKQLSLSLPTVIPQLTGVLTDSHTQVRTSANKSLKQFGEVINNPEIQKLVPVLLKAYVDPDKVSAALASLLKTSFVHYIDSPSLALVVPIIERGLKERSAEPKRRAVQIVGNMASLTDAKDFVPYLTRLMPLVHVVLVDPVPEARATASKALGTLVERLGEGHFPDLVPSLIRTLKTENSGVDRQGAAQGLSEVLAGLGMERLEGLLPDIISNSQSSRSTVKEGFMTLLVYLPATFGTRFQPHLPKIISPILNGLADQEEVVREAAMRAGRMIVTNYANKAVDLLLPELERGMFDEGWRIRQSSITLVGELLFKLSGISGKPDVDEEEKDEDNEETLGVGDTSKKLLLDVLGQARRDRILAALYLVRQDAVSVVRTSSIQIWKALVNNTPRTVREILPDIMNKVVSLVASNGFEQRETAARSIGELCRKFGEKIIGEITSILQNNLQSPDSRTREGVCLALTQVLESTSDSQRENHEDILVAMVRKCLVDDDANVRSAAAKAFDALQEHIGPKAIDATIPTLLEALKQPGESSGTALQALKEVMSVRASTVFPVLIPTLTAIPMTAFNARALASLVTVAGNALSKRLTSILGTLAKTTETESNDEVLKEVDEAIGALLSSVSDMEGLNTLMLLLLGWVKNEGPVRQATALRFFGLFCQHTDLDFSLYRIDWVRQLVPLLDDTHEKVVDAGWISFDQFIKSIPKDEMEGIVVPLRRTIESTGTPGQPVRGFCIHKGVGPIVPVIVAGLTTGSHEQREHAAYAIGELVERTTEAAIRPYVVPFTGPLIRVATQSSAYPPGVKSAIFTALGTMLDRIPALVKPFFPQLQRTFVKGTSDPSSLAARTRAAAALGSLMRSQSRVDPVITELIGSVRAQGDAVGASLMLALANVVREGSANVGENARESCMELVGEIFGESHDDSFNQSTGALFAALSSDAASVKGIVEMQLLGDTPASALSSHCILASLLSSESSGSPSVFATLDVLASVGKKISENAASDKPSISRPAREARDIFARISS